eukprot:SAG11_NODE_5972_length_1422_cov_1.489040_3_plen_30_part_01
MCLARANGAGGAPATDARPASRESSPTQGG